MKQIEPRLEKKVALISGASRGLGKAMALRFAKEGASVTVNYLKNANPVREIRQAIVAADGKAICVQADVPQSSQVNCMVQTV
jgi:3-oxoacyl-[acyl-carrier protein] reductase